MVGSIQNNTSLLSSVSSQYYRENQIKQADEAKAEEKKAKPGGIESGTTVTSIDGDTLTISSEGAAAASAASPEMQGVTPEMMNSSAVPAVSGTATDVAVSSLTAGKTDAETTSVEDYTVSEDDEDSDSLSDYTESELAQMLYKGEITQAEYDAEIQSRNGAAAVEE